jgi:hypothetical protein
MRPSLPKPVSFWVRRKFWTSIARRYCPKKRPARRLVHQRDDRLRVSI